VAINVGQLLGRLFRTSPVQVPLRAVFRVAQAAFQVLAGGSATLEKLVAAPAVEVLAVLGVAVALQDLGAVLCQVACFVWPGFESFQVVGAHALLHLRAGRGFPVPGIVAVPGVEVFAPGRSAVVVQDPDVQAAFELELCLGFGSRSSGQQHKG